MPTKSHISKDNGMIISMRASNDPSKWGNLLESITLDNERLMLSGNYPDLYESGIVYRPELGTEHWQHANELLQNKIGDCEDLAMYRAAQLRTKYNIDARPAVVKTGNGVYHAVVAGPDGTILEDPTKLIKIAEHMRNRSRPAWSIQKRGNKYLGAWGTPAQFYNDFGIPTVKGYVQTLGADPDPGSALLKALEASIMEKNKETTGAGVNSLLSVMPGMISKDTDPAILLMLLNSKEINTPEKNKILMQYMASKEANKTGLEEMLKKLTENSTKTENAEIKKLLEEMKKNQKAGYGSAKSDPYSTAIKEGAGLLKDEQFRKDLASAGKYLEKGAGRAGRSISRGLKSLFKW